MAEISKQALIVENNQSFPNNNNGQITPSVLRNFNSDMIDSTVNQLVYTEDSSSWSNSISYINDFTSSISISVDLTYVNQATASLQLFSASARIQLANLEINSASVNTSIANINAFTASSRVSTTSLNAFTASTNQRLSSIEGQSGSWITESETGSFAILGANNTFTGTTNTFNNNVTVLGTLTAVSASFQYTTSSVVVVGQNKIVLNTDTPSTRFGGISVQDSGSVGNPSGSLYWDSVNNHWLYQQPSGSGEGYNSAVLIAGPRNTGSLGNEQTLTIGRVPVASGEDHISDGRITDSGTMVSISTDTTITGSLTITGTVDGVDVSVFATNVNTTTASLNTSVANLNSFSASTLSRLAVLEIETSQLEIFTSSQLLINNGYNAVTASLQSQLATIGSISGSWVTESETSSFARVNTTNSFTGSQIFSGSLTMTTGSLTITGSAYGNVVPLSVTSNTASIDLSRASFFSLNIPSAATTRIEATNIRPGQTINILLTQPATTGSLVFSNSFKWPFGFAYSASTLANAVDIVTLISFDNTSVYGTSVKNLL